MSEPRDARSTDTAPPAAAPEPRRAPLAIVHGFARLALGYWRGPDAWRAWLLSAAFISFVFVGLGFQIAYTQWSRFFFNALENKDAASVVLGVQYILMLTLAAVASAFTFSQINLRLRLRWREWLTLHLIGAWLINRRFYQLSIVSDAPSNPEYRIAEDIRVATEVPMDIVFGLSSALLSGITFIGVLWLVGGAIEIPLAGRTLDVPGYMVWGVIAYSGLSSTLMALVGRPLIARVEMKNAAEATFRYEVTRVRENAEDIALVGASNAERGRLEQAFKSLAAKWVEVIDRMSRMTGLSNGNITLAPTVPLMLAAPKYLAGQLTLGEVMQLASAFFIVHQALNWLADNSVRIAEWLASADRVAEFSDALDRTGRSEGSGNTGRIAFGHSGDDTIHVEGLVIEDPSGAALVEGPDITIERGEHVLVQGASGTGKSTLVRTLAGLWPWGRGRILLPADARVSFVLQRPYVPAGTLRYALCYPTGEAGNRDEAMVRALARCELSHLAGRLGDSEDWGRTLSGGEQQRLAFARLLIRPPTIVVLDEATSALDEAGELRMMAIFDAELAGVTVIGVGRRALHERFYDRKISLLGPQRRPSTAQAGRIGARRPTAADSV